MPIGQLKLFLLSMSVLLPLLAIAATESPGAKTFVQQGCNFQDFVELSSYDQRGLITACSPEDQVKLFLAWSNYTLPRNWDYASEIAKTGDPLLPVFISTLEKNESISDMDMVGIFTVIGIMRKNRYSEVVNDSVLMSTIKDKILSINGRGGPSEHWVVLLTTGYCLLQLVRILFATLHGLRRRSFSMLSIAEIATARSEAGRIQVPATFLTYFCLCGITPRTPPLGFSTSPLYLGITWICRCGMDWPAASPILTPTL
jgi:hypothetical protein